MVLEGAAGVNEIVYRFNSKKYANSKWIGRIFCLRCELSNDGIISA